MIEHKFTDDEIIRALECCIDGSGTGLIKATLDLINRKNAEIERLKDNEKYIVMNGVDEVKIIFNRKEIKAEARKECAKEICEEIIKRFDRLLKAEPNRGTTTNAKDFLEAHLPYVINSILKGITEEAGK